MIIIINEDAVRFSRNGELYDKSFRARAVSSDKVILQDIRTGRDAWKGADFSDYEIDGLTYGTQLETINALMEVIYSGVGGAVTISNENGTPTGTYEPLPTMSYQRLMYNNVDEARSSIPGFTGNIKDLFEDQYSTIVNSSGDAIKTVDIVFKLSMQSIIATLQCGSGDFSNVKFYLTYSNGAAVPIFDNSADNTKLQNEVITASDVIGANGVRIEFHTTDEVCLGSLFIAQINSVASLIQAKSSLTNQLETVSSTGRFLNVFTKEKEYESPENKWGQNDDIDIGTAPETIWDGSSIYTYTETPVIYASSSDNIGDTESITAELITLEPGTGDYIEEIVTLTLNGQNQVNFVPPSGNLVVACNRAFNSNGNLLLGDVYIYENGATLVGGIPTDLSLVRAIITTEAQQTRQTPYVIPDVDKKGNRIIEGHLIKWQASVVKTNSIVADVFIMVQENGKVMRARDTVNVKNGVPGGWTWGDRAPEKLPTKSRIEIRCINISANDGSIVGKFQLQNVTENEQS